MNDEPGCRQFDVLQDEANHNCIVLYEICKDTAAFAAHRETPHVKKFFAASKEMIAKQTLHRLARIAANA